MAASEQVLLAYVAAWNEADEEKRRALLEFSWAENGIYSDPTAQVSGREALVVNETASCRNFETIWCRYYSRFSAGSEA